MTQPAKSQEPSMEEILASIRRIIADDDANRTVPREVEAPPPAARSDASPEPPAAAPEPSVADILADVPEPPPAEAEPEADQIPDILDLTEFDGGPDAQSTCARSRAAVS